MRVDGNEVGTWEAIITVFAGYDETAKIKRFVHAANGTDDDKFITLEDCRKMIGKVEKPIHVIIDDWLSGEMYTYGNHGDYWEKVGTTEGYV